MGYRISETIFDPQQNVFAKLCTHGTAPTIEILWPGENKSPVDGLIERLPAGVVYHMCYETKDLTAALAALAETGNRVVCISPPTPAPLFGDRKVSFYNIIGIGLVEILS